MWFDHLHTIPPVRGCVSLRSRVRGRDTGGNERTQRRARYGVEWTGVAVAKAHTSAKAVRGRGAVPERIESTPELTLRDCFTLRILLIHDYRRILLKDPQLPDDLLSPDWQGARARELCARVYRLVAARAEAFIDAEVETFDGPPAPAEEEFWRRFGGVAQG